MESWEALFEDLKRSLQCMGITALTSSVAGTASGGPLYDVEVYFYPLGETPPTLEADMTEELLQELVDTSILALCQDLVKSNETTLTHIWSSETGIMRVEVSYSNPITGGPFDSRSFYCKN